MARDRRPWAVLALAVLPMAVGYVLGLQTVAGGLSQRDMLDAVAAVQRRSPLFLISSPVPADGWARGGNLYLCRTPRTAVDTEWLPKHPDRAGNKWAGVVCFSGTTDPCVCYQPWVTDGADRCVRYGTFAMYGDPELLREVRAALDSAGFRPID